MSKSPADCHVCCSLVFPRGEPSVAEGVFVVSSSINLVLKTFFLVLSDGSVCVLTRLPPSPDVEVMSLTAILACSRGLSSMLAIFVDCSLILLLACLLTY